MTLEKYGVKFKMILEDPVAKLILMKIGENGFFVKQDYPEFVVNKEIVDRKLSELIDKNIIRISY